MIFLSSLIEKGGIFIVLKVWVNANSAGNEKMTFVGYLMPMKVGEGEVLYSRSRLHQLAMMIMGDTTKLVWYGQRLLWLEHVV